MKLFVNGKLGNLKMSDPIISMLLESFSAAILNRAEKLFKISVIEVRQLFDSGLGEYLEKQTLRFESTRTILRGATSVYFYDIYYPLKLIPHGIKRDLSKYTYDSKGSYAAIELTSVELLFENIDTNKKRMIAVVGDAGSGKSTISKHLFLLCIKEKYKIPVFIELRNLKVKEQRLSEYIKSIIFREKIALDDRIYQRLLS